MRAALLLATTVALALPAPLAAKRKLPPQVDAWATCAAQKNASDVIWSYVLESGQSGLKGAALGGARVYAIAMMMRDCVPEGTALDDDALTALSQKAIAAWKGDRAARSVPRAGDDWADCLATNESAKGRAFLFARDVGFGGPALIVQGVDPIAAIEATSPACDGLRPTAIKRSDLYARLNFRLRVEPRLASTGAPA